MHLMSSRIKIILVFCLFFAHAVFSQNRVSPQLINKKFKIELNKTVLTISVIDSGAFQKKYLNKITILQKQPDANCFIVRLIKQNTWEDLKNDHNVIFIDHHEKPKEESVLEYVNWAFNRITKMHYFFPDLNGATQQVSIKEQGFDPLDIDLLNRSFSTSVTPSTTSQHATAMATLIAGGGNSSVLSQGVAPQARFTSSDFTTILPDNTSIFTTNSMYVQNHSYGVGIENYYGNEAFAYDQQVTTNPVLLHVFSAGNSGKSKPASGTYVNMEFATLSGNFKQAKNTLVVNAVDTTLTVNALNSRGPAFDGRLKPELTAYGQDGTSDAAAIVSGISVLIQEKHQQDYQRPADASLIKAILIASSDDIGPTGIDFVTGYGSVNAYKALTLMSLNQIFTTTIVSNEDVVIPITIPASASEVKVAIVWTDPPAAPNSNTVLMNDLDSWLDDGTVITRPWVLNPFPKIDSLQAPAKRKEDHLNNVEYITINKPKPGTYQLHIKAGPLTTATQNVSVAYWLNQENSFSWDFPLVDDMIEGGVKNLLVWEAMPDQTGDLYLSLNNNDWQLIQSDIDLNHSFYWSSPDIFSKAKLKMKIGATEFSTEEFIISPALKIKDAFVCADSVGLTWNSIKNATGYELYTMGDQYLKKIATTQDTLLVFMKSANQFFSVSPLINDVSGVRSKTINYTQQGALCYLSLFAADRISADQVRVQLQISSWYRIDHISIIKTTNGLASIINNIAAGESLILDFTDNDLQSGLMTYQAEIVFQDGRKIVSDLIEILVEEKGKAIIYPNPVTTSTDLTILTEGGGITFRILDLFGRVVFEKKLTLVEDAIDVFHLPAGVYLYQLVSLQRITDTGKFVKY
ncbi:MAG: hypothetical protein RI909_1521 [Bacteroidota bacterium]|jgi:hypothetical protein